MSTDQVGSKYFFEFCEYRSVEIPRARINPVIADRIYDTPVVQQGFIVDRYEIGSRTIRHLSLIGDDQPPTGGPSAMLVHGASVG
jgi:hypothetical protein